MNRNQGVNLNRKQGVNLDRKLGVSLCGISNQTARTDLMSLVELGYLIEKKQGKKILYFKSPQFDVKMEQLYKQT